MSSGCDELVVIADLPGEGALVDNLGPSCEHMYLFPKPLDFFRRGVSNASQPGTT